MIRNGRKWGCLTWCHSIVYDHVRIFILTLFVVFSTSTPLQSQWFMHDTSYISYISYWSMVHGDGDQLLGAKIVSSHVHAASPSLRLRGMRCERLGPKGRPMESPCDLWIFIPPLKWMLLAIGYGPALWWPAFPKHILVENGEIETDFKPSSASCPRMGPNIALRGIPQFSQQSTCSRFLVELL